MPEDQDTVGQPQPNGVVENAIITQAPPFEAFFDDDDLSEGLLDHHDDAAEDDAAEPFDFSALDVAEETFQDVDDDDDIADDGFSLADVDDAPVLTAPVGAAPEPAVTDDATAARLAKLETAA